MKKHAGVQFGSVPDAAYQQIAIRVISSLTTPDMEFIPMLTHSSNHRVRVEVGPHPMFWIGQLRL